jgi:hypothetical protein
MNKSERCQNNEPCFRSQEVTVRIFIHVVILFYKQEKQNFLISSFESGPTSTKSFSFYTDKHRMTLI